MAFDFVLVFVARDRLLFEAGTVKNGEQDSVLVVIPDLGRLATFTLVSILD